MGPLRAHLAASRLAIFLDFDGTLAPIVDRPDQAALLPGLQPVLASLAARAPLAVVSGRDRADVAARVGLDGIVIAGSHGFDIAGPGVHLQHPAGTAARRGLETARAILAAALATTPGAQLEPKAFSLAVHFRRVPAERRAEVAGLARRVAGQLGLRAEGGHLVVDLQPAADWNKGAAVLWLLDALRLPADTHPLYIGDDVTDEHAFRALAHRGTTVLVAAGPRPTAATWWLPDPPAVRTLLTQLAQGSGSHHDPSIS